MSRFTCACAAAVVWTIASAAPARAQTITGTWVQQTSNGPGMTMIVDACCNGGRRFTYRIQSAPGADTILMSIDSPLDGTDAPVMIGGKPSGETMGIKRIDDHHLTAVLKMNGATFGMSRATISADGKTLTVESEITSAAGGGTPGKTTETWLRK
jgi:hypothetical protein